MVGRYLGVSGMRPHDYNKRTQTGTALAITSGWMVAWTVLLLFLALVVVACTANQWRDTAEFCEALSPVMRVLAECIKHG